MALDKSICQMNLWVERCPFLKLTWAILVGCDLFSSLLQPHFWLIWFLHKSSNSLNFHHPVILFFYNIWLSTKFKILVLVFFSFQSSGFPGTWHGSDGCYGSPLQSFWLCCLSVDPLRIQALPEYHYPWSAGLETLQHGKESMTKRSKND